MPLKYELLEQGCTALNAADPNPAYVCVILKTNPERWEAWTHQITSDKRYILESLLNNLFKTCLRGVLPALAHVVCVMCHAEGTNL